MNAMFFTDSEEDTPLYIVDIEDQKLEKKLALASLQQADISLIIADISVIKQV